MQIADFKSDKIFSIEHQLRKVKDQIAAMEQEVQVLDSKLEKNGKQIDELTKHDHTLQMIGKKYGVGFETLKKINAYFEPLTSSA
mmetsp:Transcript_12446/g.19474  ORF Transcript_12446/g.19474 Transcript_12446/m.19474 type:complete len:85 (+) Transcript_12446:83-337(+)